MGTYIAKHRIITTENGQRREYAAGQPIVLSDEVAKGETKSQAQKLLDKGAIWKDRAAADEAAKAVVEGVKSAAPAAELVHTDGDGKTDAEREAEADQKISDEADAAAKAADAKTAAARATAAAKPVPAAAAVAAAKRDVV